jgi:hypothetical protein
MTLGTELRDVINRTFGANCQLSNDNFSIDAARIERGNRHHVLSHPHRTACKKVSLHAPDCKPELPNVAFQDPEHQRHSSRLAPF